MDCSREDGVSSPKSQRINDGEKAARQWSDLPPEILLSIADSLGIIELLGFRGVCKDWNSAAATASAAIESLAPHEPWFLLYGESSQCVLLSESGKKYTINVPELDGATCLASSKGWLLLLKGSSVYFFCPFSRAKIDLPKLPNLEFSNCIAAFSSTPTSQDCIVSFMCQNDKSDLELLILYRGDNAWTQHKCTKSRRDIRTIKCALYREDEEAFYFSDDRSGLVTFSLQDQSWKRYEIIWDRKDTKAEPMPFYYNRNYFMDRYMKQQLGLEKDVSISTCGTAVALDNSNKRQIIYNETIEASTVRESRQLKGLWIHPRFFQVPPNHSW